MNYSTESNPVAGRRLPLRVMLSALAATAAVAALAFWSPSAGATAAPAAATQPLAPQFDLVHAERFRVAKPFRHLWRADRPLVQEGWLLVLSGDEELLKPRQAKEPVLYVGAQTAERINTAQGSGRLVVLVPGNFPLDGTQVFLGSEALPEELRQPQISAELEAATARGVPPLAAASVARAVQAGVTEFADDFALRLRAIDLVEAHSPNEKELIAGWRVPYVPNTAPR